MSTTHAPPTPAPLLDRIGIPHTLVWGYLGLLLFMVGDGVETSYLSTYFKADLGFSETSVGVVFTAYGITAAIGAFLSGGLSDLWGPRRVMMIGATCWATCHAVMLAVAVPTGSYLLILLSYGARGFGYPLFAYGFLVWIMAGAPEKQLGKALGWFWFSFTMGYPVLGAALVSGLKPAIGFYPTLWVSLVLIVAGAGIAFTLLRERSGYQGLAAETERTSLVSTLVGCLTIMLNQPKVGMGALVRLINTTSQFGVWVFTPLYLIEQVGFTAEEWASILVVMMVSNLACVVLFGALGDRWSRRKTVAWLGGVVSAFACLALYYVPALAGHDYLLVAIAAGALGVGMAGYVPLPPLMTMLAPERKGQVMSSYTLGAGASMAFGPLIGTVFIGSLGIQGVMWIYAALHLLSTVLVLAMKPSDG
ncbi:MFS transporter [Saccharopolyspora phatthalungensis]|uniref:Polyol permease family n=1 Tax=Saccharopolyspora phatthalungensis TaxID=664693 RepID=A0A840QKG8_9PSEU|nr:MFS transporter [Saccharopolyspora phatthalungensis]MBB5160009.1 polyol permease family [Saccharopolyspora phatthalungensis]